MFLGLEVACPEGIGELRLCPHRTVGRAIEMVLSRDQDVHHRPSAPAGRACQAPLVRCRGVNPQGAVPWDDPAGSAASHGASLMISPLRSAPAGLSYAAPPAAG